MIFQKTIQSPFLVEGIGLHSGSIVELSIHPAPVNHGIVFEKIRAKKSSQIKACYKLVHNTMLCTTLADKNKDNQIGTVEHLLSAIYALGIDNLLIKIKGDEVPIMDGSSGPFFKTLSDIGLTEQPEAKKKYLKILKEIKVSNQDGYALVKPYDGFKLFFEIDFSHPAIKATSQTYSIDLSKSFKSYEKVSNARTFGFLSDSEALKKRNLALGASVDNAIVLTEDSLNKGQSLRNKAEFVQHKLLDAIGDLSLCGFNLLASYEGYKAGHKLNHNLICKIFENQNHYQII